MHFARLFLIPIACTALIGCDSTPKPVAPPLVTGEPVFKQLAEVYKYISYQRAKVPASPADLEEYSGSCEDALRLIKSGDVVVNWGVGHSPSSNEILAYDKEAGNAGGYVLLRNGTVKQVTAAEFKSSAKPGGSKP